MSDANKQALEMQPSRREFLRTSTLAAVGGGIAATLGTARMAHAAGSDTIRIGLIGCGGRGTGAAAQALKADENTRLVAMGDAFQDRLDSSLAGLLKDESLVKRISVPKEKQFVGFDAYQKVLAADVDLVILATPPGFRPIHFQAAVEAGKHSFIEKPVAVDAPGVRTVLEAGRLAKQKNLAVGVGLQRRHSPNYLQAMQRLHDGAIGDMVAARVYWNGAGVWVEPRREGQTDMEYQMRNWYYFNWLCGDHIVEQHIHNLDVINWLKGAHPVRAEGMGGRQVRTGPDFGEIYDHHAVEFEYADGTRMFSYCRHIPNCWDAVSEHIHGTKGSADLDSANASIHPKEGEDWRFRGRRGNPFQIEHNDLFASIRAGSPLNEAEYGATSTMTSILGRMATYSGQMLDWDKALASNISLAPQEYDWHASPPVPRVATPGITEVI